jgi:hypothetical protein
MAKRAQTRRRLAPARRARGPPLASPRRSTCIARHHRLALVAVGVVPTARASPTTSGAARSARRVTVSLPSKSH